MRKVEATSQAQSRRALAVDSRLQAAFTEACPYSDIVVILISMRSAYFLRY
jgi:hypothetical protein